MVVCASCGQENPAVARFCLACGLPLDRPEAQPREERRLVSVVFVDMVGFTSLAERMDPEPRSPTATTPSGRFGQR